MAKYYGQVHGQAPTIASRRGSATSGIKASVQSWDGSIIMHLRDTKWGENQLCIEYAGDSSFTGKDIFDGPMEEFVHMCLRHERGD